MKTTTTEEQKPVLQQVPIWKCRNSDCRAWVRDEFMNEAGRQCPLCQGPMIRSYKHVPVIPKKRGSRSPK